MTRLDLSTLLAVLTLTLATPDTALAQQWGQISAPRWGQQVPPAWGQYNNQLGVPWQYNRTLAPPEPTGAILSPNQTASTFANPSTGKSLFVPQDTRFKGRNQP